jgi:hypothetical protein
MRPAELPEANLSLLESPMRYELQPLLRRNSWLRRRLRAEDSLEAFAVLKEDQHPQHTGH